MKSKLMRLETKMQILIVPDNKHIVEVKAKYSNELYIMKNIAVSILIKIIMMVII